MNRNLNIQFPQLTALAKLLNKSLVFIDLETTTMIYKSTFGVTQVALLTINPNGITNLKCTFVDPENPIEPIVIEKTKITNEMVKNQRTWKEVGPLVIDVLKDNVVCGFNIKSFDLPAIKKVNTTYNLIEPEFLDVLDYKIIDRRVRSDSKGKLEELIKLYRVNTNVIYNYIDASYHRADYDVLATALLAEEMYERFGYEINEPVDKKSKVKSVKDTSTTTAELDNKKTPKSVIAKDMLITAFASGIHSEKELMKLANDDITEITLAFKLKDLVMNGDIDYKHLIHHDSISFLDQYGYDIISQLWTNQENKGKIKPVFEELLKKEQCPSEMSYLQLNIWLTYIYKDVSVSFDY